MTGHPKKLLFLVSDDRYFCSHRLNLAKAARDKGFEVAVATRCTFQDHDDHNVIQKQGIRVFPLRHFNRTGINPFSQLLTLYELYKIYKAFKPDIVHHVALKPVLLGTLIAKICRVPKIINALGGLGYLFVEDDKKNKEFSKKSGTFKKKLLRFIVCKLYAIAFSQKNCNLLLQNNDDFETLIRHGALKRESKALLKLAEIEAAAEAEVKAKIKANKEQTSSTKHHANNVFIIPGSGINTATFQVTTHPASPPVIITCISRMLWDKGIGELVEATKILQEKLATLSLSGISSIYSITQPKNVFKVVLYGSPDPENPASIPIEILNNWNNTGIIEWRGFCNNAAKAYAECHIAVLPSYREGLPKSLLEAASCGKPIITTDVPGCREVVTDKENGYLVPARNVKLLADRMLELIQNENLRKIMGEKGRARIESSFSEAVIHNKVFELYLNGETKC